MILKLKTRQIRLLRRENDKTRPNEACALLFGKLMDNDADVTRVVITPNTLRSTVRFEIDPQAFFKAFTKANEKGLEFIGFFHSHPAPANPSAVDLQSMKLWGDAVWLILSQTDGGMAAFRMKESRVEELTIKVE